METVATRRHLPHLESAGKSYFVTFVTVDREILPPQARDIALACCIHHHTHAYWLHCAVIMPDHAHLILTPYEVSTLHEIVGAIKGTSSHRINQGTHRHGHLWQDESFDRIVRTSEDLRKKCEYVCDNPVRAGLVTSADDWPWLWREWVEGQPRAAVLHGNYGNAHSRRS
jgi:REP-associated tyrosine transposase